MDSHNVTDSVKLLLHLLQMASGKQETLPRIPIFLAGALMIELISFTNTVVQTEGYRVLLYIGFTMSASVFNKHNKYGNIFWYPDHHSEDGKTSYRKATFKTASL